MIASGETITKRKMRAWRAAIVMTAENTATRPERRTGSRSQNTPLKLPYVAKAAKPIPAAVPMPSIAVMTPDTEKSCALFDMVPFVMAMFWMLRKNSWKLWPRILLTSTASVQIR